ncbi:p24capsid [Helicoverpa armigera nucleopolyhedrovirus]|uniref:P24capsid n=2 Tax=Helicoverpa armigera nucleopolyhedrovirus TaxID=51313 RepID=Q77LW0_9ABAC|nr:p24capsid [Helicoverpa armigera nucleopolyhedrovirus G4]AAF78933.1 p24 capsid protein [Helicoverpa armigera nucleopolyhedrovirus]AAG53861.1 p24capsid [Helicoverpa armigera nucleopolyhedrovirus G4]
MNSNHTYEGTTGTINDPIVNTNQQTQFQYDNDVIDVFIVENNEDDRDGFVELTAAVRLLAPVVAIRGFNKSVLWANVNNSHKLTRHGKNYVHAYVLCRHLSLYNSSNRQSHSNEYYMLKRLVCDLLVGAQSQIVDPLSDIKNQLCTLRECIENGVVTTNQQMYQSMPTTAQHLFENNTNNSNNNNLQQQIDMIREILRNEHNTLYGNISSQLDSIKSIQIDLTNKIAFSNDTMLDSFKSIKDVINRKK